MLSICRRKKTWKGFSVPAQVSFNSAWLRIRWFLCSRVFSTSLLAPEVPGWKFPVEPHETWSAGRSSPPSLLELQIFKWGCLYFHFDFSEGQRISRLSFLNHRMTTQRARGRPPAELNGKGWLKVSAVATPISVIRLPFFSIFSSFAWFDITKTRLTIAWKSETTPSAYQACCPWPIAAPTRTAASSSSRRTSALAWVSV